MVIDASVILRGFFPDEEGQAEAQSLIQRYAFGTLELIAPTLLPYEVTNAIVQAVRRDRIQPQVAAEILESFRDLAIPVFEPALDQMLDYACCYDRSAYDAAYLALAAERDVPLITGDRRLYNAVQAHLDWVLWIGEQV